MIPNSNTSVIQFPYCVASCIRLWIMLLLVLFSTARNQYYNSRERGIFISKVKRGELEKFTLKNETTSFRQSHLILFSAIFQFRFEKAEKNQRATQQHALFEVLIHKSLQWRDFVVCPRICVSRRYYLGVSSSLWSL